MTPPRRSPTIKVWSISSVPSPSTSFPTSSLPLRRSPRLNGLSTIIKPYKSPMLNQMSVRAIGESLENTHLPGQKRRSSQAITPLRKETTNGEKITGITNDEGSSNAPLTPRNIPQNLIFTPKSRRPFVEPATLPIPISSNLDPSSQDSGYSSAVSDGQYDLCGLPPQTQQLYKEKRHIDKLYDWQRDCLSDARIQSGHNVIISLPTGAGKTLVAEVLMLREAIVHHCSSLLILPYVAIVQEKMTSLSVFEDAFDIQVEEYAASKGRLPPIKRAKGKKSIYVATIEKANMLVNSLIENDRLNEIGLIVVDELHMIGEGSRGACIESLLCKYRQRGKGQIVGMSATLSNIDELAQFMNAFVYSTNFRPVELTELVKIGQRMLRVNHGSGTLIHHADLPPNSLASRDPDGICQLLQPVIPRHSAIIFCPTKKNCENVAILIAKALPKNLRELKKEERLALITIIKEEGDGHSDEILEKCMEAGIAWHHSGLTHDERKHIEAAFVAGTLCVLCATSTLAAGVNLPARRVIIRAPVVGRDRIRKSQYLQMIGRAGRAGFDERGESVTIVRAGGEETAFRTMLRHEQMRCDSSFNDPEEMTGFVLDVISLKVASTVDELQAIMRSTLLSIQKGDDTVPELTQFAIDRLKKEELIVEDNEGGLTVTEVGAAAFGASVSPQQSTVLRSDLMSTLKSGVNFSSHLHLLFIVAPYDLTCSVDWDLFWKEFQLLPQSEKQLLESSGVSMKRIMAQISSRKLLEAGESAMRLYIALMMQHVWRQEPHNEVAKNFSVDRGWLQAALQSIVSHASAIARFAERLPSTLWPLKLLLPELVSRLGECTRPELVPLMKIDLVKRRRASQLYSAGFKTVADVARGNTEGMMKNVENLGRYQANKMIQSARALLRDEMDEKMEEIEAMGVGDQCVNRLRLALEENDK